LDFRQRQDSEKDLEKLRGEVLSFGHLWLMVFETLIEIDTNRTLAIVISSMFALPPSVEPTTRFPPSSPFHSYTP
jgi:hypothetical protein